MPYIYRVTRRNPTAPPVVTVKAVPSVRSVVVVEEEPSYQELQAQAKELGISGKQKAGKLKKAIAEAKRNG